MAISQNLMREFDFEVSTDGSSYVTISGINNASITRNYGEADGTVFDDDGWQKGLNTSAGIVVSLEGFWLADATNDLRDTGQAMVEASAGQFGFAGLRYYKVSHENSSSTLAFQASAKLGDNSGGNDDLVPWSVELTVYGKPVASGGLWSDEFA